MSLREISYSPYTVNMREREGGGENIINAHKKYLSFFNRKNKLEIIAK